jgi:transposase
VLVNADTGGVDHAHDGKAALAMLDTLQPDAILLADRAYDSNAIRGLAAEKGAWANIPPKKNRTGSFPFSRWVYKQRNLVERYFNKIKHFRGIATRYDRDPLNFLAAIKLASVRIWLRAYESAA